MLTSPIDRIVYKYIYDSVMKQLLECYRTTFKLKTDWHYVCDRIQEDTLLSTFYGSRTWKYKTKTKYCKELINLVCVPMHVSMKKDALKMYCDNAS